MESGFCRKMCIRDSRVTIVEALPRLLANLDKDISQNLKMILKKRGIKIYTGAMVKRLSLIHI